MPNNEKGGRSGAIKCAMVAILYETTYGVYLFIFGSIAAFCAGVLYYVPGGSLQADCFRWAATIVGVFSLAVLIVLAIIDLIQGKKTQQKSTQ